MRAAIVIEAWKFSIFQQRLEDAGFKIEKVHKMDKKTQFLVVEYEEKDAVKLAEVVIDAVKETKK